MPPVYRKNRLAFDRRVLGMEQREIARSIGVSPRTVSNWELDLRVPTRENAEPVARLLNVSVRKLWPHEAWKA